MQDPQVLRAGRHLHAEQRLDRAAERHCIEVVGEVVHPLDDRDHLPVGLVLGGLLDPGVDVADHRPDVAHDLALQRGDQPQNAVGGGVMRADVEGEQLMVLAHAGRLGRHRDRLLAAAVVARRGHWNFP